MSAPKLSSLSELEGHYQVQSRASFDALKPSLSADLFEAILESAYWRKRVRALANVYEVMEQGAGLPQTTSISSLAFVGAKAYGKYSPARRQNARRQAALKPGPCPRCGLSRHWGRCKENSAAHQKVGAK